ncbi:purine-nucleoside phosphorylase [Clostridiales bacterium COT073_COT-073]|nr:purine-nucleoside phosphorylase [Clostridiales bacterium COT073_COT-073]
MNIPTPHIEITNPEVLAKTVLMPGDPLRAKFIAETFLKNVIQINSVRNMFGYTGEYQGKKVTVMGSGMGMPSIGIYSYELFSFYDVDNIIRIGSAGAYTEDLNVYDVVLATDAWSESTYAKTQSGDDSSILAASSILNNRLSAAAAKLGIPMHTGRIHSSDVFYRSGNAQSFTEIRDQHHCVAVEMESFALFANAKVLDKNAACLVTISDSLVKNQITTSEERQTAFQNMMKIALDAVE